MNCRGRAVDPWSRARGFKWRAHISSCLLCSSLPQFCILPHYFNLSWSPPLLERLWFGHIWQIEWWGWCHVTGNLTRKCYPVWHSSSEWSGGLEKLTQKYPEFTEQSFRQAWLPNYHHRATSQRSAPFFLEVHKAVLNLCRTFTMLNGTVCWGYDYRHGQEWFKPGALVLQLTKMTTQSIGHTRGSLIFFDCYLWLNFKDCESCERKLCF